MQRKTVIYRGHVQGVGFRWRVVRSLRPLAVSGFVRNVADGSVELLLEGEPPVLDAALDRIDKEWGAFIRTREEQLDSATGEFDTFDIRR